MTMITDTVLFNYKERFINLICSIKRPGADITGLLTYLEEINFFTAPATTQYACNFEGGLLIHSLNTFDNMINSISRMTEQSGIGNSEYFNCALKCLLKNIDKDDEEIVKLLNEENDILSTNCSDFTSVNTVYNHVIDNRKALIYLYESCVILGLLHDISKATSFEPYVKNEKVYSENGKQSDTLGKFDWVSSIKYKYREMSDKVVIGNSGFSSFYEISKFLPLTAQESAALNNQFSLSEEPSSVISGVINSYPLTLILHEASNIAYYITDKFYVKE